MEPNFRLEIGTNDEEEVEITVEQKTNGEWRGIHTVQGRSLFDALNNARRSIEEAAGD